MRESDGRGGSGDGDGVVCVRVMVEGVVAMAMVWYACVWVSEREGVRV